MKERVDFEIDRAAQKVYLWFVSGERRRWTWYEGEAYERFVAWFENQADPFTGN